MRVYVCDEEWIGYLVNDELQMTWTELIVAFCYRDTDKSLALPEMKKKLMFVSEWRKFPSAPVQACNGIGYKAHINWTLQSNDK